MARTTNRITNSEFPQKVVRKILYMTLSNSSHPRSPSSFSTLNAGYVWVALNVLCSAAYVLGTCELIMWVNSKEWDSKFATSITWQQ